MTTTRTMIRPFTGLRPRTEDAAAVAAPPYDVLSSDEARFGGSGFHNRAARSKKGEMHGFDQHITLTLSCLAKARELLAEGEGNSPRDRNLRLWDLEKALTEAQSVLSLARSRAELLPGLIRAEELLHCLFL